MPTGKFAPKTKPVFPVALHSERLQRVIRAHKDLNFTYELNHTKDRAEVLLDLYAQKPKFAPYVKSKLMSFVRAKIPEANMFELDENGTLDEKHRVKEALVWSESKKVMDPENPVTNALVHATILHGVYSKPYGVNRKDEFGNVIEKGTKITNHVNTFYIEFTEKNVKEVLEQFRGKYRVLTMTYANPGSKTWYQLPTYSIPNLQDSIHEDFDNLIAANMGGFLRSDDEGGVQLYLKDKAEKKKKIQAEIAEFKKTNRGK